MGSGPAKDWFDSQLLRAATSRPKYVTDPQDDEGGFENKTERSLSYMDPSVSDRLMTTPTRNLANDLAFAHSANT